MNPSSMPTLVEERPRQTRVTQGMATATKRPNVWVRWTSTGWREQPRTAAQREMSRRSRLTSWVILGLLVTTAVLIPSGLADPGTLAAIGGASVCLLLALVLNRAGQVSLAGMLLVLMISAAVLYAIAGVKGGLALVYLPGFDLLVISVVVAASVLPRWATFATAALNIALILLDFQFQPHAPDLAQAVTTFGVAAMVTRPIALQVIVAVIAFLWVRGTDEAIRRADRAEEIAALEHSIAEQKRQLDVGIQQLLETHVRAANGDFSARAPLRQDNVLWQIGYSLNNLLARMQRTAQAEHQLARTQDELRRLAAAIDDAQAGRQPLWPAPTGTAADLILERVARGPRRRAVPSAPYDPGQPGMPGGPHTPGSMGWPSISSQPLGQSPYAPSSQPLGHSPFSQAPSSQPLAPSPYAPSSQPLGHSPYAPYQASHQAPQPPDSWQLPDRVDDAQAQPNPSPHPLPGPLPNPWVLPAEQTEQPRP